MTHALMMIYQIILGDKIAKTSAETMLHHLTYNITSLLETYEGWIVYLSCVKYYLAKLFNNSFRQFNIDS
jgi:hypothetical protein